MPGYLDQYGAGEERRENVVKLLIAAALFLVVFGSLGWYLFKNHSQESEIRSFLTAIRRKDYAAAYRTWGCTQAKPCSGYPYEKFMEDWGPRAQTSVLRISDSESCNAGVIVTVDIGPDRQEKLWAEKNSRLLSFSPFPYCPNKTPLANMIHQTVGKLRKPFLN